MSLIFDEVEIETFHLDDLSSILKHYPLKKFWAKDGWNELNRANLIKYSTQLQFEGKGVIKDGTKNLIKIIKRRKYGK